MKMKHLKTFLFLFSFSAMLISCSEKSSSEKMKQLVLEDLGLMKWYHFDRIPKEYDTLFEISKARSSLYYVVFKKRADMYYNYMFYSNGEEVIPIFNTKENNKKSEEIEPVVFNKILKDNHITTSDSMKFYFSLIHAQTPERNSFKIINSKNDLHEFMTESPIIFDISDNIDTTKLSFDFDNRTIEYYLWIQFDGLYKVSIKWNSDSINSSNLQYIGTLGNEKIRI